MPSFPWHRTPSLSGLFVILTMFVVEFILKHWFEPWQVWLSWLGIILDTEESSGQVPGVQAPCMVGRVQEVLIYVLLSCQYFSFSFSPLPSLKTQ